MILDLDQIPAGIVIWVYDLTEGADNLLQYTPNRRNGSYVFNLIPCHEYLVEYTQNEEIFYSTEFKLPCEANYQEINKVITIGGIPLSEEDSTASGDQKNTITNNENNTTTSPEIDTKTETKSQNNQSTIAPVNFQIFYGYNEKGISSEQEKFNAFIDGINEIITINGKVQIELEGSASSVPTKSYIAIKT